MFHKLVRVFERLAAEGFPTTARYAWHVLSERVNDRLLDIDTIPLVRPADLGFTDRERKGYEPTAYRDFRAMMKWVVVRPGLDVFLDYGSGKGRVLALAAGYPFRRVLGIEISEMMIEASRMNLRNGRRHLQCSDIEVIMADAATYPLPDDVTVIHFFNPFEGNLLARVISNIGESFRRSPRQITILYNNPIHLEPLLPSFDWLKPVVRGKRPSLTAPKGNLSDFYAVYRTAG